MAPLVPQGHRIRNAFNGETFVFVQSEEREDMAEFEVVLERGGMTMGSGRAHVHPDAEESFAMTSGRLRLWVDGARVELGPGESVTVPRGASHYFRNGHDGETVVVSRFTPGRQFLRFFLNMTRGMAEHPDWYDARGKPPLLLRALALHAYRGNGYAGDVPIWVQKAVFAALAPVALLWGCRLSVRPRRRPWWGGRREEAGRAAA
jgi:quercetin dioxygenase-like cupin family protein